MDYVKEILTLKKEKNAIILAHNYQPPYIQDIADYIGDSLELCLNAKRARAKLIVFCGVRFMAETAAILNPKTPVILPEPLHSTCSLAKMLLPFHLKKLREEYPNAKVVLYINTSAEAKAEADCICTSANAARVVNAMDSEVIIFGPDVNLLYHVKKQTSKLLIPAVSNGHCPPHVNITLKTIKSAKALHPKAEVIVHPETPPEVQDFADHVASTSGILKYCKTSDAGEFIIGTENGMLYRLNKEMPNKKFYPASPHAICSGMKTITLPKLFEALENEKNIVEVENSIAKRARDAIENMLRL